MPAAARQGDAGVAHCSGYTIANGSPDVFIENKPVARQGDASTPHLKPAPRACRVHTATISGGSNTVFVNGKPIARVGDGLGGCTSVAQGSPTVFAA